MNTAAEHIIEDAKILGETTWKSASNKAKATVHDIKSGANKAGKKTARIAKAIAGSPYAQSALIIAEVAVFTFLATTAMRLAYRGGYHTANSMLDTIPQEDRFMPYQQLPSE